MHGTRLRKETMPAALNSRFHVCTSLAPRSLTVVFGLGTRLRVHMHTTLENGVLCNRQQPGRAENSSIDQGELVAMKTLMVVKLHAVISIMQFCDEMTVST